MNGDRERVPSRENCICKVPGGGVAFGKGTGIAGKQRKKEET